MPAVKPLAEVWKWSSRNGKNSKVNLEIVTLIIGMFSLND